MLHLTSSNKDIGDINNNVRCTTHCHRGRGGRRWQVAGGMWWQPVFTLFSAQTRTLLQYKRIEDKHELEWEHLPWKSQPSHSPKSSSLMSATLHHWWFLPVASPSPALLWHLLFAVSYCACRRHKWRTRIRASVWVFPSPVTEGRGSPSVDLSLLAILGD